MIAFIYLVGIIVSFISWTYLDVKGSKFLFTMRSRTDASDVFDRVMMGSIGSLMWPLALLAIVISKLYGALIWIFSRQPKKPKIWTCPRIKPANGYREPIERCAVKTKSVNRPKCGVHHCSMIEDC